MRSGDHRHCIIIFHCNILHLPHKYIYIHVGWLNSVLLYRQLINKTLFSEFFFWKFGHTIDMHWSKSSMRMRKDFMQISIPFRLNLPKMSPFLLFP